MTSQKADDTGLGAAFLPLLDDRLFNLLAAFLALRMLVILLFALPAERPERTESAIYGVYDVSPMRQLRDVNTVYSQRRKKEV